MGLSSRTPSTADTYKFIPEIYSAKIESAVKDELVAWGCINSSWQSELNKGDTLYIPKSNVVTATEVVVGTKGTSLNPFNTSQASISIDQWFEAPVDIGYMTKKQTQAAMEAEAIEIAKFAIMERIDTTVCTLFSSLGGYSTSAYGTDGQSLTDDLLLALLQTLNEANVPKNDRFAVLDPSAVIDLLKIDKFISANYTNIGAVKNGNLGNSVYGFNVRETNNLVAATTGAYAVLMQKRAIGGAAQIMNSWRKEFEELHQTRYQSEALWGVAVVNNAFGIPFFTRHA